MKAFIATKYGSLDHFGICEVAKPLPKKNEVLVKVHAVSLNDWDWGYFEGIQKGGWFVRLGLGLFRPKIILGCDVAGRVESVGSEARKFKAGDAVFGDLSAYFGGFGGFAEFVCAAEDRWTLKPQGMTFEQAAAIPQAGVLIVQALAAGGPIKSGQRILINGAGGGCGTMGIQLAKRHDVEVTGVDNEGKLDLMRSLGFDHVIDYKKEDFSRNGKLYDLIVDTKSTRPPSDIVRALTPQGTYATVGGNSHVGSFAFTKRLNRWRFKRSMSMVMLKPNSALPYLCDLFDEGKFRPIIDRPYRFTDSDILAAFTRFGAGEHLGKIVVTVCSS